MTSTTGGEMGFFRSTLVLLTVFVLGSAFGDTVSQAQSSTPPATGSWDRVGRRPTAETQQTVAENSPYWVPELAKNAIGYETSSNSLLNVFGQNAVMYGTWSGGWGYDLYFGYTRGDGSFSETSTTADNAITNARTVTTTRLGAKAPHTFIVGAGLKQRLLQNSWFTLHWGPVVAVTAPTSITYDTGSRTETYASKDSPDKTITDTSYGSVKDETSLGISVGPRVGTEFYLKWFPHLSLGFATGILMTWGAETTSTTNTRSRTVQVVNGEEQTPSSDSASTSVSQSSKGIRGRTFGLGGTSFSFTGTFSIKYVW